jgi:apoptotic chromatin condensation inducer in the nucleus
VTNLVRPFTLSQLQDFLRVHGEFSDFWIDKIKSNCILKYDSVESAINCRKIIHGKKWPSSNPKSLRVIYTTTEKLELAKSGNLTGSVSSKETIRREKNKSESRSPNRGNMRSDKEFAKDKAASSDESEEGDEGPDIQLDDLFKKTKTTPALYWSPLTDAQVQQRDEAREERRKQREQRRKESEERKMNEKTERKKSGDHHNRKSRSRSKRRSRSRSRSR